MFVNQIVPENEFKEEPSNSGFFVCKTNIPLSCFKNDVKSIHIPRNSPSAHCYEKCVSKSRTFSHLFLKNIDIFHLFLDSSAFSSVSFAVSQFLLGKCASCVWKVARYRRIKYHPRPQTMRRPFPLQARILRASNCLHCIASLIIAH